MKLVARDIAHGTDFFRRLFEFMARLLDGIPSLRSVSSVVSLAISPKKDTGEKNLMSRSQCPSLKTVGVASANMQNFHKVLRVLMMLILIHSLTLPEHAFAKDIQKPAVAGSFFPANSEKLKNMVDGFIDKAELEPVDGEIIALVLPHAGYQYSGWVAGYGVKLIKNKEFDTVIIVGLSHRVPFKGLSVLYKDSYQTPLGNVAIDKDISKKLIAYSENISYYELPFSMEHSAEVEIPFMQRALPDSKIVVILTGDFSYETVCLLRDALNSVIKTSKKKILLIASTDMSHFFPEQKARDLDARTMKEMEKFQPEALFKKCLSWLNSERPCNSIGMLGVMMAAKKLGANKLKVVKYATSGDVTFDSSRVVGYCAAVVYKSTVHSPQPTVKSEKENTMEGLLNEVQKKRLLEIARKTLQDYIKKGQTPEFKEDDPVLNKELGAFVTLHKHGDLRGCIGNVTGKGPLYLTVRDMAIASSTEDFRFPKVVKDELDDIDIEISVLSKMQRIDDPAKIIMGKHGVLVKSGFRSGVFLPQVAEQMNYDKELFMNSLCAHKAGLPADAWKKGECEIFIYTAEVFGEK